MQGNEACAEGALAAGLSFFAGYPITPSTEIAEYLAEHLPARGGVYIQMEDEIASMAAVVGASLAGAKAMTATSGPGFSLKQENLGFAAITEAPCVVVNVQRQGPSTGLPTSPSHGDLMQARWGTHGDHPVVVLVPWSVRECFDLTLHAFNVAERLRIPVVILTDEVIAHMREKVVLPEAGSLVVEDRARPDRAAGPALPYDDRQGDVPPMTVFGDGHRAHVTGLIHDRRGYPAGPGPATEALLKRLQGKVDSRPELVIAEEEETADAEVLVVAIGCVARSAARAIRLARAEGIAAGLLRPVTLWPFPGERVRAIAGRVRGIVVPEMNLGQMVLEVERVAGGRAPVHLYPRVDGNLITPEEVLGSIREVARG
ncbi:MAG: 2-oxoacid:acceptor oxidoreductase subunit alpha [bacterium]|nr:2-oxoacid:acceptor oxidoreductase subunit alpha [bacterium]